ncbi:hypothetical protein [Hymenobacter rubidus]|uniref:hypothetical protein n=1 Tax=Hymenobacter rubidus TaxID=1441626 RepID=UPI00191F7E5F|nr:hypothetical protein [Hymenobacter rubidus]
MITLHFSHWWLLLVLALVLLFVISRQDGGSGPAGALAFVLVALLCLAIFLIALAAMVGFSLGHN